MPGLRDGKRNWKFMKFLAVDNAVSWLTLKSKGRTVEELDVAVEIWIIVPHHLGIIKIYCV